MQIRASVGAISGTNYIVLTMLTLHMTALSLMINSQQEHISRQHPKGLFMHSCSQNWTKQAAALTVATWMSQGQYLVATVSKCLFCLVPRSLPPHPWRGGRGPQNKDKCCLRTLECVAFNPYAGAPNDIESYIATLRPVIGEASNSFFPSLVPRPTPVLLFGLCWLILRT